MQYVLRIRRAAMLVIGLTGGIGSGKSTVSVMLAELGAPILNADLVGHEAYLPHQNVWQVVVEAFGRGILNEREEVDRRKLGALVFEDPEALKRLNQIVHPWMYRRMEGLLQDLKHRGTQVVVLEAAVLIEAGWAPLVDQVWVTVASDENVVKRLQARNGLTEEQVLSRIKTQMPSEERLRHANAVIDTNGTVEEVRAQVRQLWNVKVPV